MKKITLSFLAFIALLNCSFGQIFLFDFGPDVAGGTEAVTVDNATGTPTFQKGALLNNLNYFNGSTDNCSAFNVGAARSAANWTAGGQFYQTTVNTTNYTSMTFSACLRSSAGTNAGEFQLRASTDGATWTDIGALYAWPSTAVGILTISQAIPAAFDNQPNVIFQLLNSGADAATAAVRIDKMQLVGTPLPIELTVFKSTQTTEGIELFWQTASELNNDFIAVEHSADGVNFREIGRKIGKGNSNDLNSYRFTDVKPENGTNFYRLRQVDFDGTTTYSDIISEQFNRGNKKGITLSPTFVQNGEMLNLDIAEMVEGELVIDIFNTNGQSVKSYNMDAGERISLPIDGLSNGLYFVKIKGSEEVVRFFVGN
jgi:hypothetical protein